MRASVNTQSTGDAKYRRKSFWRLFEFEMNYDFADSRWAGRKIAMRMGIHVTGVIGVLIEAKRRQLIPAVIPLLDQLRSEMGFFLSEKFLNEIRHNVDE